MKSFSIPPSFIKLFFLIGFAISIIACKDDPPPPAPFVNFTFPDSLKEGMELMFSNQTENALTFSWTSEPPVFSSTEENPIFTFEESGEYAITLTAQGEGGELSLTKNLRIEEDKFWRLTNNDTKTWVIVSELLNGEELVVNDCQSDDIISFNKDFQYEISEGNKICSDALILLPSQKGEYGYKLDFTQIVFLTTEVESNIINPVNFFDIQLLSKDRIEASTFFIYLGLIFNLEIVLEPQ